MAEVQPLNYSYDKAKAYSDLIGLKWLGDDFVRAADTEAKALDFTQDQVDAAMRHHLWQVRYLFSPENYGWRRFLVAWHFAFGKMPAVKQTGDLSGQ